MRRGVEGRAGWFSSVDLGLSGSDCSSDHGRRHRQCSMLRVAMDWMHGYDLLLLLKIVRVAEIFLKWREKKWREKILNWNNISKERYLRSKDVRSKISR